MGAICGFSTAFYFRKTDLPAEIILDDDEDEEEEEFTAYELTDNDEKK